MLRCRCFKDHSIVKRRIHVARRPGAKFVSSFRTSHVVFVDLHLDRGCYENLKSSNHEMTAMCHDSCDQLTTAVACTVQLVHRDLYTTHTYERSCKYTLSLTHKQLTCSARRRNAATASSHVVHTHLARKTRRTPRPAACSTCHYSRISSFLLIAPSSTVRRCKLTALPLARRLRHLSLKSDRCREREAARPPRAHKRANGHSFSRLPYLKPSEPLPRRRPHPSAAANAALGCCAPFPSRRTCAADGDALTQGSPWFADRARPNDEPSSQ